MNRLSLVSVLVVQVWIGACAGRGDAELEPRAGSRAGDVVGRLLLPGGPEARGVEVVVERVTETGDVVRAWLPLDAAGRFAHSMGEAPSRVTVDAGGVVVHEVDGTGLAALARPEGLDLGVIDLRGELVAHRMRVVAAEGSSGGDARIAMFDGPPPVGPYGGSVSLGSRQFPGFPLGSELEWAVARDAADIYLLVERPVGPGRGREWRSGAQQLFGPFTAADLPARIAVD